MERQLREDCLEAALALSRAGTPITAGALSSQLCLTDEEIGNELRILERSGELAGKDEEGYSLTPSGLRIAEQTERKHRLLQEFFSRVLGMDHEAASKEACTLEHTVSEDAISRLGSFIEDAPCCRFRGRHGDGQETLAVQPEGAAVVVQGIRGCQRQERLMALGIVPGTTLSVLRNGRGRSLMIRVKGCEIAVSREIARSVLVEPAR
jgi:DtxR family Mn-dependent transcriptional regulator